MNKFEKIAIQSGTVHLTLRHLIEEGHLNWMSNDKFNFLKNEIVNAITTEYMPKLELEKSKRYEMLIYKTISQLAFKSLKELHPNIEHGQLVYLTNYTLIVFKIHLTLWCKKNNFHFSYLPLKSAPAHGETGYSELDSLWRELIELEPMEGILGYISGEKSYDSTGKGVDLLSSWLLYELSTIYYKTVGDKDRAEWKSIRTLVDIYQKIVSKCLRNTKEVLNITSLETESSSQKRRVDMFLKICKSQNICPDLAFLDFYNPYF